MQVKLAVTRRSHRCRRRRDRRRDPVGGRPTVTPSRGRIRSRSATATTTSSFASTQDRRKISSAAFGLGLTPADVEGGFRRQPGSLSDNYLLIVDATTQSHVVARRHPSPTARCRRRAGPVSRSTRQSVFVCSCTSSWPISSAFLRPCHALSVVTVHNPPVFSSFAPDSRRARSPRSPTRSSTAPIETRINPKTEHHSIRDNSGFSRIERETPAQRKKLSHLAQVPYHGIGPNVAVEDRSPRPERRFRGSIPAQPQPPKTAASRPEKEAGTRSPP